MTKNFDKQAAITEIFRLSALFLDKSAPMEISGAAAFNMGIICAQYFPEETAIYFKELQESPIPPKNGLDLQRDAMAGGMNAVKDSLAELEQYLERISR